MACYVIQQIANQSGMCTCTHKINYHGVFRALLLHIILSTVCSTHVEKLWFHCNIIFVLFTVKSRLPSKALHLQHFKYVFHVLYDIICYIICFCFICLYFDVIGVEMNACFLFCRIICVVVCNV